MGLGRVLLAAATARTNVRLGGVALLVAAALGSWRLLAASAALYAALVGVDLASPAFRERALEGSRPQP